MDCSRLHSECISISAGKNEKEAEGSLKSMTTKLVTSAFHPWYSTFQNHEHLIDLEPRGSPSGSRVSWLEVRLMGWGRAWLGYVALVCERYFRCLNCPKDVIKSTLCLCGCTVVIELAQMLMKSTQAMWGREPRFSPWWGRKQQIWTYIESKTGCGLGRVTNGLQSFNPTTMETRQEV